MGAACSLLASQNKTRFKVGGEMRKDEGGELGERVGRVRKGGKWD